MTTYTAVSRKIEGEEIKVERIDLTDEVNEYIAAFHAGEVLEEVDVWAIAWGLYENHRDADPEIDWDFQERE